MASGVDPKKIYAIDVREGFLSKLQDELGVNIINSEGKPVAKQIKELSGKKGGIDAAIDCFGSGGPLKGGYAALKEIASAGVGDGEGQLDFKGFRAWLFEQFAQKGTVNDAYGAVRRGGNIEVIGSRGDQFLRPTQDFMANEVNANGPWGGIPDDAQEVLQDIKEARLQNLELLLGQEQPFTAEGFGAGVQALRKSEVMGRVFYKM